MSFFYWLRGMRKTGGGEKAGFVELLFATTALFDQLHTGRFSTKPTRYVS